MNAAAARPRRATDGTARPSLAAHLKTPAWLAPASSASSARPDYDVVLSARARLARNLEGLPFPHRAQPRDLRRVAQAVRQAAHADADHLAYLHPISVEALSERDRAALVDARRISPELADGGVERFALLDDNGALSIFVNEEDHVRLQTLAPGNDLSAALRAAQDVESRLARRLRWAHDPVRWGYQTASLGNVGTGLRLSLLMHLPALAYLGRLAETLRVIHGLDISIRGAHGERSVAVGDLYQVSNAISFGLPSGHIVGRVKPVGDHLVAAERAARSEIARTEAAGVIAAARDAWARVEGADGLSAAEVLGLLSKLRLAAAAGLTPFAGKSPAPDAALFAALLADLRTGAGLAVSPGEPGPATSALLDAIQRSARVRSALRPFYDTPR